MRSRLLYPLTAAVLAVHAIVLLAPGLPTWLQPRAAAAPEDLRFTARSITPPPAQSPAVAAQTPSKPAPRALPKSASPIQASPAPAPAPVSQTPDMTTSTSAPATSPAAAANLDDLLGDSNAPAEPQQDSTDAPAPHAMDTPASASPPAPSPGPVSSASTAVAPQASPAEAPLGIGSAGYTGALPAARVPPSMELKFNATGSVKRFHYSANASLQWQTDGKRYQARQEVSAFLIGSRAQTSTGRVDLNGLVPQRFGDKTRSERVAQFDATPNRVDFSNGNTSPVTPGVQDRLSIFIQLASMFAAAPERYPPGTAIRVNTASATSTALWTFVVDGPEKLDLPEGQRETIRLTRKQLSGDDQKAQLWLAPELNYLPVRIHLSQPDGDFVDLSLQSATKLP